MFRNFKNLLLVVLFLAVALPGWTQTSGIDGIAQTADLTYDSQDRIKPVERGNDTDGYGRYYHWIIPAASTAVQTSPIGVRGWDSLSAQIVMEASATYTASGQLAGPILLVTPGTPLSAVVELQGNLYPGGTPTVTSGLKTWGIDDPDTTYDDANSSWYASIGVDKAPINTVAMTSVSSQAVTNVSGICDVTSQIRWPGIYQYDVYGLDRVLFAVSGNSATQHIFLRVNTAPDKLRGEN